MYCYCCCCSYLFIEDVVFCVIIAADTVSALGVSSCCLRSNLMDEDEDGLEVDVMALDGSGLSGCQLGVQWRK